MICPRCQQSVRDGARFCDSCGLSIGSIAAANQSPDVLAETLKAVDPLIGHVIDSKYQIIEQLGKGGMGVVYRAERVLVGDEVALKILRGEFVAEEETVERFRREARAAAKLRHPNVVTIYDYGEARGADAPAYIVMELLNGQSLRDLLKREGRLEPERAVQLMRGICAGIGLAHRRQIVHRDIKPDNIILLPPDEEEGREQEMVKVVDFGIAKLRDAATGGTLTRKGFQPGTIFYMSPEQCRGDSLDAQTFTLWAHCSTKCSRAHRIRLGRSNQTVSDCMTCTGMCWSGARIGIIIVITERRQTGALGRAKGSKSTGCCAAARGATMPATSAPPNASGTRPTIVATTTASVLWRLRGLSSFRTFAFARMQKAKST